MDDGTRNDPPARDMDVAQASGRPQWTQFAPSLDGDDTSRSRPDASMDGENREPAQIQWRAAILAVQRAAERYRELLDTPTAAERAIDLAWLALWRAERQRDAVLELDY